MSVPRYFEYHLAHRTENGTQILQVSKNDQLLGSRTYVIGYRIVLSFLVIYVVPMTTLVALNGRILAALWRASRGPVALAGSTQMTTGSQRGRDDAAAEDGGKASSGSRCSRHQLSNCSRCGTD